MSDRLEMTVKMHVTVPQALALQAMFKHWDRLASWGSSRFIGFYADGDGDFKPKCQVSFSEEIPTLTPELEKASMVKNDGRGAASFDFDPIARMLHQPEKKDE